MSDEDAKDEVPSSVDPDEKTNERASNFGWGIGLFVAGGGMLANQLGWIKTRRLVCTGNPNGPCCQLFVQSNKALMIASRATNRDVQDGHRCRAAHRVARQPSRRQNKTQPAGGLSAN